MKKIFTQTGLIVILLLCLVSFAKGQISLTSTGGTTPSAIYTTLKGAFDKINDGTTHTGDITILVTGNTTETASAILGKTGVYISPFGTPNYTSVNISPTAASGGRTISGNVAGPIIWLQNSDNVTIDGYNDGFGSSTRSITVSNSYVGVAPFSSYWTTLYSSGSNITIKNCTFLGASQSSGVVYLSAITSSNNIFKGCSVGPAGASLPSRGITATGDNLTIDSCRVYDFAYEGIDAGGCTNPIITRNRIYQTAPRTTTGSMFGIYAAGSAQITGNTIGYGCNCTSGTFTVTTGGSFIGIYSALTSPATSTDVINISNNIISNISITSTNNSTSFVGISSGWSGDAPGVTQTINNNTVQNISLLTTQSYFWGIYFGNAYNTTINSNNINTISRNATAGSTQTIGLYGSAYNKTITNNTVHTLSSSAASNTQLIGMELIADNVAATNSTTLLQGNTIYGFTGSASMTGIRYYSSTTDDDMTGVTINVNGNTVYNLASTSVGSGAVGILVFNVKNATASNLYNNKVHSLQAATVTGIRHGGSITNTYNNYIGFTHANTVGSIITGLSVSGPQLAANALPTDSYAAYNNTIYINDVTSSAANFNALGIDGTSQKSNGLLLQNNLVINRGIPKGTGKAIALKWAGSGYPISYISTASNNNSFYSGIPSATRLIYSDDNVVNDKQTLATYQTYMSPRETNTISESSYWLLGSSADGTQANYLHIAAGNITKLESGGINVALFNTDYDGDNRPGPTGSTYGGATAYDIGADEFDCVRPTCITPTPGNTLTSAAAVCYGGNATLSLQNTLAGTGYVYQWQSSPNGSGYADIAGATGVTYNATNITTDGYFRCYITCYNSPATTAYSTAVQITIHKITGTTPASRCGTGTVVLGAAGATGTINWYSALTGGSSIGTGTSFTTPSISSTTSYFVDITNATLGCTSGPRIEVIATVNPLPTITSTTPGSRCGTGTVSLAATSSEGFLSWYTASTGGTFIGSNSPITTPSISSTTTYYVQTTSMIGCTSPRTAVIASVYSPAITGTTPANRCNAGAVTLSATGSSGSTLKWYAASTGGTALFTGASYTIPFLTVTTTYYVEASESTCASVRTAVVATINTTVTPSISIASSLGSTICSGVSVTFTATPVNGGSAPTYNFRKNGSTVQNSSSATYTTTSLVNGDVISCIITANNPCQTTSTANSNTITMTVNSSVTPAISIVSDPASGIICGSGNNVTFTATPVNGGGGPLYNFKVNGTSVQNSSSNVYSSATLANNDVITCEMTANNTCQTVSLVISNSITITYGPPVPGLDGYTIINTASDIEIANAECTGADGWTTYYNTINKKIILSIKKNGNNIGSIGDPGFVVESGTTANYNTNTATPITAPYVTVANWYVMNRYWKVTPGTQPSSDVNIRTYYTLQDISDVQGSVPSATESTVAFFKINGAGDPNPANGHTGIASASAYNTTGYWQYSYGVSASTSNWAIGSVTGGRFAEYTVASFSGGGGGASPTGGALPIRLVSFTTQLQNNNTVLLQWLLAEPEDDGKYELQRSADGRNFVSVNSQTGDAAKIQFTYADERLNNGIYYYKLKMTDANGKITYSNIALIKMGDNKQSITLYPNPVQKGGSLQLSLQNTIVNKIELFNTMGQTVYTQTGRYSGSLSIPVSAALTGGQYMMRLTDSNGVIKTEKFFVY